jgi:UDP-GlcNAc:undecaprenyl-phosphate GlcNAc-1-phosphate transferase
VSLLHYAALIAFAAVVTLALTPFVRGISERFGLVDRPGGRKVHQEPISRVGGVAIFVGVMSTLGLQAFGEAQLGWNRVLLESSDGDLRLLGVLGGITVMFVVGLIDDVICLTPGAKFAGQIVAAGVVVASGLRIDYVGDPIRGGLAQLGLLAIPVTVIYLVGFANVINLIDGLDGLAAGVSGIAAMSLLALAAPANRLDAAAIAAALIGACLGFLRYNFNPASIFMGDSGAMFLGFALASVSLLGVMKTTAAIALAVPLIILGVPIFDTASAILRRIRHSRPIHEADRGHIHHRLLGRGFDQRQTVLIIYAWSAALALGGYAVRYSPGYMRFAALAALLAVTAFMAHWLGLFEAAHRHDEDDPDEAPCGS